MRNNPGPFVIKLSEVMDHVGWTHRHTALYYFQLAKVFNPAGASAGLAQVDLRSVTSEWENLNELKCFVSALRDRRRLSESVLLCKHHWVDIPGFIDLINLF